MSTEINQQFFYTTLIKQVEENSRATRESEQMLRSASVKIEVSQSELKSELREGLSSIRKDLAHNRENADREVLAQEKVLQALQSDMAEEAEAARRWRTEETEASRQWRTDTDSRLAAIESSVDALEKADKEQASAVSAATALAQNAALTAARSDGQRASWWETQSLITKIVIGLIGFALTAGGGALVRHFWNDDRPAATGKSDSKPEAKPAGKVPRESAGAGSPQ